MIKESREILSSSSSSSRNVVTSVHLIGPLSLLASAGEDHTVGLWRLGDRRREVRSDMYGFFCCCLEHIGDFRPEKSDKAGKIRKEE